MSTSATAQRRGTVIAPPRLSRTAVGARLSVGLVVLVVLSLIPLEATPFTNEILTGIIVLAIAMLSVNLITGFAGQVTVAQGVFVGLGAYATALLVTKAHWPDLAALAAAAGLCLLVGLLTGIPALRIKGMYLTLVTLAMAVVFPTLLQHFTSLTGGSAGLTMPAYTSPFSSLAADQWCYYLALVGAILAFAVVRNLMRGRIGRALIATRDNEAAGLAYGVPVDVYKVAAFGVGAMVGGFAGALLMITQQFPFTDPSTFSLTYSINLLVGAVVGGITSILGPFVGAAFINRGTNFVQSTLGINPVLVPVAFGVVLILLMTLAPGGVAALLSRLWATTERRLGRDRVMDPAADSAPGADEGEQAPADPVREAPSAWSLRAIKRGER